MKNKSKLFLSMLVNPLFIIVYGIAWRELFLLCQYGYLQRNIPILFCCGLFFLIWLIWFIIRCIRKKKFDINEKYRRFYNVWICVALVIIVSITGIFGYRVYESGKKGQGYLGSKLDELKYTKKITYKNKNKIYKDGLIVIIDNIAKKVDLPKDIYIGSLDITFEKDGTITSFSGSLYDKKEKDKITLFDYSKSLSDKIEIHLDNYGNTEPEKDYKFSELNKLLNTIPIKNDVERWSGEEEYGIIYRGERNWEYDESGIVYIDANGNVREATKALSEIKGKTISVYVPNKEDTITPRRYNLVNNIKCIEAEDYIGTSVESEEDTENTLKIGELEVEEDGSILYKFNENIEYRLEVTDASLGSRSYALYKKDSGKENLWTEINSCPFKMAMGQAASITFINEDLGFLVLSYSGGISGKLFRTEDGGKSYEEIEVKSETREFMGSQYTPFDFPERIYEKDGYLYMKVGQGSDGDYNGNSMGLYKSKDKGKTWEFEKEVSGEYN